MRTSGSLNERNIALADLDDGDNFCGERGRNRTFNLLIKRRVWRSFQVTEFIGFLLLTQSVRLLAGYALIRCFTPVFDVSSPKKSPKSKRDTPST